MDPLAHTLVGAALAETSLAHRSEPAKDGAAAGTAARIPLATATLVLGANLPDVDFVFYFLGSDLALEHRRGWTHGVLAWALLPLLFVGLLAAWDRSLRRRREPELEPAPLGTLLGLSYLALLTHPLLDWLNTYGIRLLMPFDDRWFYGDSLFIVDIWLWLVVGGAVFLARARRGPRWRAERWMWGTVALLAALAVLAGGEAAPGGGAPVLQGLWLAGLLGVVVLYLRSRHRPEETRGGRRAVTWALGLLGAYVALSLTATFTGRNLVLEELGRRGLEVAEPAEDLMVGPLPYDPLVRDVVVRLSPDGEPGRPAAAEPHYRTGRFHWWPRPRLELRESLPTLEAVEPAGVVERALAAPEVEGFAGWVRFPWAQVEPMEEGDGGGYRVYLLDARYTRRRTTGFGGAVVEVPSGVPAEASADGSE